MRPICKTYTLTATDADGICQSQSPLAAGLLTINGALAAGIPTAQHITIASDGDERGNTFTLVGTDNDGIVISEDITGPNATTTTSTKNFKTVTSVTISGASVGAVTVGVVATCELPWRLFNSHARVFNYSYDVSIGTATFTLEGTLDDVEDPTVTPTTRTVVASGSSSITGSSTAPLKALRVKVTAWTSGTIKFNTMQAGL